MSHDTVQGRPWDHFDAYLFDIDGTLLHCHDAVHYFGFCDTLTHIAGRPVNLDGVVTHGNVDAGILRDALTLAGVPEEQWRPRLPEMRERLSDFVEAHRHEFHADALPGVRAVLAHLRARGALLGTATGNFSRIGQAKLQHTGLADYFTLGGWSDGHETRSEVFRAAVAMARHAAGENASVCVMGDTPADIAAAHANGLPVIAVATGIYTRDQLAAASPDLLLPSMEALLSDIAAAS